MSDLQRGLRALTRSQAVLNGHRRRLVALLSDLCDQLAFHFALQEAHGYFDEVVDAAPRFAETAMRLRDQHSELFATLVEIVEDAERVEADDFPPGRLTGLVERVREFDAALSEHEANETRLVFEAMDRDIGGEGEPTW